MGALVASRYNLEIREFYDRLVSPCRPKKLALVACFSAKLLMILNSWCQHNAYWRGASGSQKGLSMACF